MYLQCWWSVKCTVWNTYAVWVSTTGCRIMVTETHSTLMKQIYLWLHGASWRLCRIDCCIPISLICQGSPWTYCNIWWLNIQIVNRGYLCTSEGMLPSWLSRSHWSKQRLKYCVAELKSLWACNQTKMGVSGSQLQKQSPLQKRYGNNTPTCQWNSDKTSHNKDASRKYQT